MFYFATAQNCNHLKVISPEILKDKLKACASLRPYSYLTLPAFISIWVFILSLFHQNPKMGSGKPLVVERRSSSSVAPVLFDLLLVGHSSQALTPHHLLSFWPFLSSSSQRQTALPSTDHLFHLFSSFWLPSFLTDVLSRLDYAHVISSRNTNWCVWSTTCLHWL